MAYNPWEINYVFRFRVTQLRFNYTLIMLKCRLIILTFERIFNYLLKSKVID